MQIIDENITVPKRGDWIYTIKISLVIVMLSFSCNGSYEPLDQQNESNVPYGIWVFSGKTENLEFYYSTARFEQDKRGIAFKKGNIFIERTSGWCGTPPVTYFNIEGRWELIAENKLKITCYDGIHSERIMEIIYLSDNELNVIFYAYVEKSITKAQRDSRYNN